MKRLKNLIVIILAVSFVICSLRVDTVSNAAAIKKITVNKKRITMNVGTIFRLKVNVFPKKANNKVYYKSSKKKVAAVNKKGKIKAMKKGVTHITITSKVNKKIKAKVKVTVKGVHTVKTSANTPAPPDTAGTPIPNQSPATDTPNETERPTEMPASTPAVINLCENSDFEQGTTGWSTNYDLNGLQSYTEEDGNMCGLITGRWNTASGLTKTLTGDFKQGQIISYSYRIKRTQSYKYYDTNYFVMSATYNSDTDNPVKDTDIKPDNIMLYGESDEWTTAQGKYIVTADTKSINISIYEALWGSETYDFYIDDIVFTTEELIVNIPRNRAVYQRNENNTANVTVDIKYKQGYNVYAKLWKGEQSVSDWTMLAEQNDSYTGSINNVSAGGWYKLEIKAINKADDNNVVTTYVDKVGVGEVFITGGQSNSCNFGFDIQLENSRSGGHTAAKQDTVSSYDTKYDIWKYSYDPQPNYSGGGGNGGSPWPTFGDMLTEKLGVPIGLVSTGFGGRTINQLLTENYQPIKDAIDALKPYGIRAFLIHQGCNDVDNVKANGNGPYQEDFKALIEKSRKDAGFELPWFIADIGYNMSDAQRGLCNNEDNIFLGAVTADMWDNYRAPDNLHMSTAGLIEHGKRWAQAILYQFFSN